MEHSEESKSGSLPIQGSAAFLCGDLFMGGTVAHGPLAVLLHPGAEVSAPPVNLYAAVKNVYPA